MSTTRTATGPRPNLLERFTARSRALAGAALLGVGALWAGGCESHAPRETPEGTIEAMVQAIKDGRADRLGEFFYAENPDARRLMRRTGVFLGNVQSLAKAVQEKFPDEVAALRAEAEKAAAEGRTSGFFSQLAAQAGGQATQRRRRLPAGREAEQTRSSFDQALRGLLADPYGWVEESEQRLTTAFLTDDSVALLWDGKPILPPLGMTMRLADDGRWYIVAPLDSPLLSSFTPQTPEQYALFGSLIATFDNLVIDLRKDVEEGRVRNLDELSRRAGERAFLPVAAAFFAYSDYTRRQQRQGAGGS